MKVQNIIFGFVSLFISLSMIVFIAGLSETIRNESISIVEDNFFNETSVNNTAIWDDYEAFKGSYVYTNAPLIAIVNFASLLGIFLLLAYAWRMGKDSPPVELNQIFTQFTLIILFMFYIVGIVFQYLADIFVEQLLKVLFIEIYTQAIVFRFLGEWFFGVIMFALFLCWFANQLKYFNLR